MQIITTAPATITTTTINPININLENIESIYHPMIHNVNVSVNGNVSVKNASVNSNVNASVCKRLRSQRFRLLWLLSLV